MENIRKEPSPFNLFYLKKPEVLIFALVLVVLGYFYANGGSSQNSRLDAIYAFVEPDFMETGTFKINRFIVNPAQGINTDDWSFRDNNFYSNKAPGTHFLGIPPYFIAFHFQRIFQMDAYDPILEMIDAYMINFFVSILPVAIAAVLFFRILMISLKCSERKSLFLSLCLVLATPLFPYSIQLWGHTTAAAFLVFSLYNLLATDRERETSLFWCGFWIGCATVTDYLAVIFTFSIFAYLLATEKKRCIYYIAGGLIPLFSLIFYQYYCFGSILKSSISENNPLFVQQSKMAGMFGKISVPIMLRILLSPERGILLATPILLGSIAGFIFWFNSNRKDLLLWLSVCSIVALIVLNASFNAWHGGAATYMRYQIPAIPFWILLLAKIPDTRIWRNLIILLVAISVFNMLAIASVSTECTVPLDPTIDRANIGGKIPMDNPAVASQYSNTTKNPLFGWTYSKFLNGQLSLLKSPIRHQFMHPDWERLKVYSSWNIGLLLGFKGLWSLMPLMLISTFLSFMLFKSFGKNMAS